jgi:4-hydroxybenzoate polyprenyltransferase
LSGSGVPRDGLGDIEDLAALSPATALMRIARLRLLPFVLALVFVGFAWAHWDRALPLRGEGRLLWVLGAWAALHVGTMWLNGALDRDEGEVLFGRPARPPPATRSLGYLALALSVPLAWRGDPLAGGAIVVCVLLAIAYSHPRLALKGHPLGGPLVNVVGYGLLSPLAGWSVVDVTADPRTLAVWVLCSLGIFGTYLAAQAFQGEEDSARGYRTLVATAGPGAVLRAARASVGAALLGGMLLAAIGWLPRLCLLGTVGWWVVDRHLARWIATPNGGTEADARGFTRRMLYAALLGVGLALTQYTWDSFAGRPVAGLGTASGHPPDREWHRPLGQPSQSLPSTRAIAK